MGIQKEDHQNETPRTSGQWAEQQKKGMEKQKQQQSQNTQVVQQHGGQKVVSPAGSGDALTPDKTIGEVKFARQPSQQKIGGAGEPQVWDLEPEKQGGIGGP